MGNPDTALIAACVAFAAHPEADASLPADDDLAGEDTAADLMVLMRLCADIRATTLAGHRARTRALLARIGGRPDGPLGDPIGDGLLAALLRDLAAGPPPAG